jgi:hypothetical protein
MAYSIGKTSALQTALKAGVDIAIAEFNAAVAQGAPLPSILDRVHEVADELKVELFAQADADNVTIASNPSPRSGGGSGSNGPVTLADAKGMVLNFGWAKGMTIGDVLVMSKDEANNYSGGKYKRSGLDYLRWMSQNKDPKGAFAAARAAVVVAEADRTDADLKKLAG